MAWFKKDKPSLPPSSKDADKTVHTEGLFTKCAGCRPIICKKDLEANEKVCPKCNFHSKMNARERLRSLLDDGAYDVFDQNLVTTDPLKFHDRQPYTQR